MDSQKVVLKLYVHDDRDKAKAMKVVSSLPGVESLAMNMTDRKLTVIGNVDVVVLVNKLRKICQTDVLTVGSAKDAKKKEEMKKQEDCIEEHIKASRAHALYWRPYNYNHCAEENPNACVIC